jgi:hypothetical protein
MVTEKIKYSLFKPIFEREKYAWKNIEEYEGAGGTERSIYYDSLNAVEICRNKISGIPDQQDDHLYIVKVVAALKRARERYRYEALDDGGYGVSTFHMVIKEITAIYLSLGGSEEDFAIPEDNLESQVLYHAADPWERCFRTFALGDHIGCAIEAQKILLETANDPEGAAAARRRELLLLLLISLQRTSQNETAIGLANTLMLPANYNNPWMTALIKLTVGLTGPNEAEALVQNEEERCQFNFYWGSWLLTNNMERAAMVAFNNCATADVDCNERFLALAELNPQNRAAIASVYQLNLRARRYEDNGEMQPAIDCTTHAYHLACRHIGKDDPVTTTLLLRLSRLTGAHG